MEGSVCIVLKRGNDTRMRHNTTFSIIFVQRVFKQKGFRSMNTHANKYIGKSCDSVFLCTGEQKS